MGVDWFSVFGLGLGTAVTTAVGYYTARHRYKNVHATTHALLGEDGKFKTQNESDIDEMFQSVERHEKRLQALIAEFGSKRGDPKEETTDQILKLAGQIIDECLQMSKLNIAFRTQAGRTQFTDRISERFARARQVRNRVLQVQQRGSGTSAGKAI
jgi:hypothetical protein